MPLATPDLTAFTTASPAVITYDWTDAATDTGYKTYYCSYTIDSSGARYILTPNIVEGAYTGFGSGFQPNFTDFDLTPFPRTVTIRGTAIISGQINDTGTNGSVTGEIFHYDGTTETSIGAQATSTAHSGDVMFNLTYDIPEKVFAEGDILRITLYVTNGARISIDPSESHPTGIAVTKVTIPYKTSE